jgi:hypothetical protein
VLCGAGARMGAYLKARFRLGCVRFLAAGLVLVPAGLSNKDKMVWFGAVQVQGGLRSGGCYVLTKPKGLVMVRWVGAVRVYLTSKLWLGAWLGAKRKDKKQEVRSKDNKLKLGYTLY